MPRGSLWGRPLNRRHTPLVGSPKSGVASTARLHYGSSLYIPFEHELVVSYFPVRTYAIEFNPELPSSHVPSSVQIPSGFALGRFCCSHTTSGMVFPRLGHDLELFARRISVIWALGWLFRLRGHALRPWDENHAIYDRENDSFQITYLRHDDDCR